MCMYSYIQLHNFWFKILLNNLSFLFVCFEFLRSLA